MTATLPFDMTVGCPYVVTDPEGTGYCTLAARGRPAPSPTVELRVYGQPAPQGSKRAVRMGARVTMIESSKKVAPWRQDVSAAAQRFIADWQQANGVVGAGAVLTESTWQALDGPLVAAMVFTLAKPASAPKRRTTWPQSAPDLSKLARSTEDALTTAGLWRDDARVVEYGRLAKCFPLEDPDALRSPGALVRVWTMAAWLGES